MGRPAKGPQTAAVVTIDDRTPDGFDDVVRLVRGPGDLDHFAVTREGLPAVGGAVAIRSSGIGLEEHEIHPVASGVGEGPGDLTGAAGHNVRRAWQRAADRAAVAVVCRPEDGRAVPDARHAQPQVHVTGQQRPAVGGVASRDGPVVAAEDHLRFVRSGEDPLPWAQLRLVRWCLLCRCDGPDGRASCRSRHPAGARAAVGDLGAATGSPRGRGPTASSNLRRLSSSTGSRISFRRRENTGIATTAYLRRITS